MSSMMCGGISGEPSRMSCMAKDRASRGITSDVPPFHISDSLHICPLPWLSSWNVMPEWSRVQRSSGRCRLPKGFVCGFFERSSMVLSKGCCRRQNGKLFQGLQECLCLWSCMRLSLCVCGIRFEATVVVPGFHLFQEMTVAAV